VLLFCTYNESQAIIHPTIEHIINTNGLATVKRSFIAYEEKRSTEEKSGKPLNIAPL